MKVTEIPKSFNTIEELKNEKNMRLMFMQKYRHRDKDCFRLVHVSRLTIDKIIDYLHDDNIVLIKIEY